MLLLLLLLRCSNDTAICLQTSFIVLPLRSQPLLLGVWFLSTGAHYAHHHALACNHNQRNILLAVTCQEACRAVGQP